MVRSKRRTPIVGICGDTDKPFKMFEHRRERRAARVALRVGNEPAHPKAFANPWASCRDGKTYLDAPEPRDMRK